MAKRNSVFNWMHILVFFQDPLSSDGKIHADSSSLQGQSPTQQGQGWSTASPRGGGGVLELFSILAGFPSYDVGYIDRALLLSFLISFPGSLPKHHLPSWRT